MPLPTSPPWDYPRAYGVYAILAYTKKGTTESTQDPENSRNAPKPKVPYIDLNISQFLNYGNGNSSKIVDENGEPLVVYHGGTFAVNDDNNIASSGMHFGTKKATLDRIFADKLSQQETDKVKVMELKKSEGILPNKIEKSVSASSDFDTLNISKIAEKINSCSKTV